MKSYPLNDPEDLDPLLKRIGDARIVMLGEASHGTHEYYVWRSSISKRLIQEKGFQFIAVEGDWPDCYRINRYIKNYEDAGNSIVEVLKGFQRWPTWMWANWEIAALADWLSGYNRKQQADKKIGFYGLDVYSLWESFEEIRQYLQKVDPSALPTAERAFQCFEPYREDEGRSYAYASQLVPSPCEDEVVELLQKIQRRMRRYDHDQEGAFDVEQNALVTVNAEKYYRAMIHGGSASWNVRDGHMHETLERLLSLHGPDSKAIVWAHNTHIGDARATDMADDGTYNIGQLAREDFSNAEVVLVGFGSYHGTVIAGKKWGAPMEKMTVPKGKPGSWEDILHHTEMENKIIITNEIDEKRFNTKFIGHRAIGVVYNPEFEYFGNYVPTILPSRYDAFIFLDTTMALHALPLEADTHMTPETYPFGV